MESKVEEPEDRFKTFMGVLIAAVALITAIALWRASISARTGGFEDYYALTAALKDNETRTLNTAKAYEHYAGFTNYAVNNELLSLLEQDQSTAGTEEERAVMDYQIWEADQLAATNRNFFTARFLKKTGEYDVNRELDEQYAEAERTLDLDAGAHLERSNRLDNKTFGMVQTLMPLGIALLFFTLAGALHPERKLLRWITALIGSVCLVAGAAMVILTELI